jgi:hypothetical protein
MAHTVASPKVPFVGIPHTFMPHTRDDAAREEVVGPIQARVRGRYASRPLPPGAHRGVPLRAALRAYALMFWAWVTRRHTPSPFFDVHSGAPIIAPLILSASQREALRERVALTARADDRTV